jgi:type I restriction enzyme S subunit
MNSQLILSKAAFYSEDRINGSKVSSDSFVSIDNMLQNKNGITNSTSLPKGSLIAFAEGDILVGNIRPYLRKIWYADRKGGCSPDVLVLKAKPGTDSRFLYYSLFRDDFFKHMLKGSKGTKMPRGDKNQILRFHLPEIAFDNQKRLANVLSALDAKIEINKRINTELLAMAKTIYDYWFVQFDFPDKNGKPYKSSGGDMIWNEKLKTEIPNEWHDGTLSEIMEIVRGVTYNNDDIKSQNEPDVIPVLRATNITANSIDIDDMVYVPSKSANDSQILNKFDILLVMSSGSKDHIGKNGFYYYDEKVAFGAFCAKLVPRLSFRYYLYSFTQSEVMLKTIRNECLGTNINNLNGSLVNGIKVVLPSKSTIDSFNQIVEPVFKKVSNNYKENLVLSSLRDWLLPMLMNEQIKPS